MHKHLAVRVASLALFLAALLLLSLGHARADDTNANLKAIMKATVAYANAGDLPLANRIPNDALLYAAWQGTDQLKPQYDHSHLKPVLDASTLPDFLRHSLPRLLEKLPDAEEEQIQIVQDLLTAAGTMANYPTAFYFGPPDMANPNQPPSPRLALLCDAGTSADAVQKQLAALVAKAGPTPFRLATKRFGTVVALTCGAVPPELEAVYSAKSPATALSADKDFHAAFAQVVQKNPAVIVYANVPAIVKVIDQAVRLDPIASANWPKIRAALNLNALTQIACTAGFDGPDWSQQAFVGATGPRTGLLALLDGKPLPDALLQNVPATATLFVAGQADVNKLFTQVLDAIAQVDPNARESAEEGLTQINATLGLDLQKDLLAPLGDQWLAYSAPNIAGNGFLGFTLLNLPRDPAKLTASLETLRLHANAQIQSHRGPGFQPDFTIHRTAFDQLQVNHIGLFIVNPAWAVTGSRFFLTLIPQAIPAAVAQTAANSKSILDNEQYLDLRKRLNVPAATSLTYVDLPRTAPDSYQTLAQFLSMGSIFGGSDIPPTILPPLHKLLPELVPAGSAAWNDAAGWHYKALAPIPGSALLSGQQMGMMGSSPALMAAVMLPSLGRSRTLANRAQDAANLSGLARACVVYAADNNDKMPQHLAELLARNQISPKSLISKGSSTKPLELTAELRQQLGTKDGTLDWKKLAPLVDQHCDYIYLGKGTENTTDSAQILAYTKPGLIDHEGVNVAFYDAHNEWIRLPQLRTLFDHTNEVRKLLKLSPITLDKAGNPTTKPAP